MKIPSKGDRVIDPLTGIRKTVKFVTDKHIQFDDATSCSVKNFPMFYSERDVEYGNESKPWISGDER